MIIPTKEQLLDPEFAPLGASSKIHQLKKQLRAEGNFFGPELEKLNKLLEETRKLPQNCWHNHPTKCAICGEPFTLPVLHAVRRRSTHLVICCHKECIPMDDLEESKVHYL